MSLSRRAFLLTSLSALAAPLVVSAQSLVDVDTVIIGAGAAGLAAAEILRQQGRSFVMLEARNRIGGRAFTETRSLGVPYDQGAHWLHNAHQNPFMEIAQDMGRGLVLSPLTDIALFDDRMPVADGLARLGRAEGKLERRLGWNSLWNGDFSPPDIGLDDPWQRAAADLAAFAMAVDLDQLSVDDFARLDGGEDYVVDGGFGALVADHAAHIPVRLKHVVRRVNWGENGRVEVSGDFGAITARCCIVTLPTTVLANGAIRFDPALPEAKTQAFEDLRCGDFFKVGMKLPDIATDRPEYTFDIGQARNGEALGFHFERLAPIVTMIASGSHAKALAGMDPPALYDLARSELAHVTDTAFASAVEGFATHDWSSDPLAGGAYSVRRLGADDAREDYAAPIAQRLYFAGEAGGGDLAVTVAGAHRSGIQAAIQSATD